MPSRNANEKIKAVPTDNLDQQKKVTRQKQLENIHRLRKRFKGSLSTSDDFSARKATEKELEL